MKKYLALLAAGLLLASCSQQSKMHTSALSPYAERPELQDAQSQAILQQYGDDAGLLAAMQEAYNEVPRQLSLPAAPALTGLDLASDRLAYVKGVSWGSVAYYNVQYANRFSPAYPGLDFSRDGCSTPSGLGLSYTEDFRPACNVHDFGYRNLKVFQRTDANRRTTDEAFYTNMKGICNAKPWYKEPPCYAAAYAYYQGVRIGGGSSFE
ncbi:phospholipase [Deinococcus psychrotolerans]|uniref:Phospholipase n=2 Tax=Deinococcus TaxID=1298 RepID=A0A553UJD5_9DEIO|nr:MULTISPECIES: phospholipase A2 [Deinococcus]AZI41749.1 phospholipase [Deinococcus psychrotolerans]TSA80313.1 phospholipase [Deinococcus detaillensis]